MAADQMPGLQQALERLLLASEVERFLYAEADLLDERRYEEWLELLADDVHYWMPLRRNVKGAEQQRENTQAGAEICWFDEGKETLTQRVAQLATGLHWAEEPVSRVCHMVSNVEILDTEPSLVTVRCRFLVYRNRLQDETDFFIGRREDVLRKVDGRWKIASRKILLDQNTLLAKNITLFF